MTTTFLITVVSDDATNDLELARAPFDAAASAFNHQLVPLGSGSRRWLDHAWARSIFEQNAMDPGRWIIVFAVGAPSIELTAHAAAVLAAIPGVISLDISPE